MASKYLVEISTFISEILPDCTDDVDLECKHFFSGAALYADGRICVTLTPVGLAIKLPQETRTQLLAAKKAIPLRYFPNAPIKKDYVLFSDGLDCDIDLISSYIIQSIEYVLIQN